MELLLGCGRSREKKIVTTGREAWNGLFTVDMNPEVEPDLVHDLSCFAPLPIADNLVDEIHIYDVLEHLAPQGDWQALFWQFSDYWRVCKDGATLHAIVPWWQGMWAWGDPGHTRVITPETLTFLDQGRYAEECDGRLSNRTDYRRWYRADWRTEWCQRTGDDGGALAFVLRAVKPSRWSPPG